MEALVIAQIAISVLGIGGLVYWMRNWFKALEGAVNAQKSTIDAQKSHIESMASIVSTLDAPAMAARVEAYKKLTEAERDAAIKDAERKFEEQKKALTESGAKAEDKVRQLAMMYHKQTSEYFEAVGLLAVNFKFRPLDWELQKHSLPPELRGRIEEVMKVMPLPVPPPPPQMLRERLTAPPDPNFTLSAALAVLEKDKK